MKLSEAIRLGAMLRPQAFGQGWNGVGTCAFSAAGEAVGANFKDPFCEVTDLFPIVQKLPSTCPACGLKPDVKAAIISVHLNDTHRWTREQIADWVESVELSLAETEQPKEAEAVTR